MNQYEMIATTYNDTLKHDGATALFNTAFKHGRYVVGDGRKGFTIPLDRFASKQGRTEFIALMEHHLPAFRADSHFDGFGTWIDKGKVYVDPVSCFSDERDAIEAALLRGELAIFDRETGTVIDTDSFRANG